MDRLGVDLMQEGVLTGQFWTTMYVKYCEFVKF